MCAVFYSTIDIEFTADFRDKKVVNYTGFLITIWGILTSIIFKPKNLAINRREKAEIINFGFANISKDVKHLINDVYGLLELRLFKSVNHVIYYRNYVML